MDVDVVLEEVAGISRDRRLAESRVRKMRGFDQALTAESRLDLELGIAEDLELQLLFFSRASFTF